MSLIYGTLENSFQGDLLEEKADCHNLQQTPYLLIIMFSFKSERKYLLSEYQHYSWAQQYTKQEKEDGGGNKNYKITFYVRNSSVENVLITNI